MSWFRSAVYRAVEAGGNNNLTRTVRNVADTVVQHAGNAVFEGAKLFQDRIGARNYRSFKQAVKRLEEVSVSSTGIERVQLLTRWLNQLKETIRLFEGTFEDGGNDPAKANISDEIKDSAAKPTVELYFDPDIGGEPMNFYDVFLQSQALEGMTLSMILEAPNEEEVSLLLEIFGLCLIGGKEVHEATVRSIQNLSKDFSRYEEEILLKREELLQYAQAAISGLKVNAGIKRIDSEVAVIHQNLDRMKSHQPSTEGDDRSQAASAPTAKDVKESLIHIQLCSRLEALLLKKKFLKNGDSPQDHAKKVDKLKVLIESLHSSASKAERRITDHRNQKEEALSFRVAKTSEVGQLEKELEAEVRSLEYRRDEIEDELKKVNSLLTAAKARLRNAREEREHFDEASNQILQHFNTKEDELSKSLASYRAETHVCNTFISFLESTWGFHSSYMEQKEKQVSDELKRHEEYFVNLAVCLLSAYKDEVRSTLNSIGKLVESLRGSEIATIMEYGNPEANSAKKHLEEEYLESEAKLIATFNVVESIRKHFVTQNMENSGKCDQRIKDLCDSLGKMKDEFNSMERPILEIETMALRPVTPRRSQSLPVKQGSEDKFILSEGTTSLISSPRKVSSQDSGEPSSFSTVKNKTARLERRPSALSALSLPKVNILSNPQDVLSKFSLALEEDSRDGLMEDIGDWEFDEPIVHHKVAQFSTK